MKHNELTKRVIELMSINNEALMTQFSVSKITEELDEVGYYANFSFPSKSKMPLLDSKFPSVVGKNKDGKIIVGFVLFTKDGLIDCLEGYTFGSELWPESDENISLEIAR